jgi:preprotein translocase subunit YajC
MRSKFDYLLSISLISLVLLYLSFLFLSCNPVKQVLKNQEMLEEVAKVVVKGGWCANDTTFIVKSDTLVEVDTLVRIDTLTDTYVLNDTTYITKWKTREITKSITIHDTIKSYIVDNARVRLLQADSARLSSEVGKWKGKADSRLNWLISLLVIIALFIYLKLKK